MDAGGGRATRIRWASVGGDEDSIRRRTEWGSQFGGGFTVKLVVMDGWLVGD